MFRIGICEDELPQQVYLEKCIKKWEKQREQKVHIRKYTSAENLLFDYENHSDFDLLILDIELGNMNGMDLARKIRQDGNSVKIIFLTGVKEYAIDGYEVGAVRYLLKPLKQEIFEELLDALVQELEQEKTESFLFTQNGQTRRIPYRNIIYVEANGHYLNMLTRTENYEWKANFSSVVQELEAQGFFLLKRGLYVNFAYVSQITRTDCILENGELLPVSKNRYKDLNEAFIAYYKEMD